MKKLPFNACDYRCERCLETDACAVFRKLEERSLLHQLHGENADDPQVVLKDVRDSFRETEEMIKQKAREFGIDIDAFAGGVTAEEIREQRASTEKDPLYKQAFRFTRDAYGFVRTAESAVAGADAEYLNDIAWHHTLVSAKVYRALGWEPDEEDIAEDAVNSAAVAVKSLTICIMALDYLASRYTGLERECRRLSGMGGEVKGSIKKRFGIGRS